MKKAWNIVGGVSAFLLCICLVATLLICPVISFFTDSIAPENIVKIIFTTNLFETAPNPEAANKNILLSNGAGISSAAFDTSSLPDGLEGVDLSALEDALHKLADSGVLSADTFKDVVTLPENAVIDEESLTQALMESTLVQTLVTTYTEDILDAALGVDSNPTLTKDTVASILKPHTDELIEIVKDVLPEGSTVNEQAMKDTVNSVLDEALPDLVESLPPVQEVVDAIVPKDNPQLQTALGVLRAIRTGRLRLAFIGAIIGLALVIVLLRLPKFSGLHWVGIAGLFGALLSGIIGYALQAKQILSMFLPFMGDATPIVNQLLSQLAHSFVICAIIYGVVSVVLIVADRLLSVFLAKKEM